MKTKFSNREVPHLWAHKTQAHARGSNIFFDGDTIYSYGRHFPIARHLKNKKGVECILFTTRDYSSTTQKHKSRVMSAIPMNMREFTFYVEHPDKYPDNSEFERLEKIAANWVFKSKKALKKNRASYLANAQGRLEEAKQLKEFFGIKGKIKTMEQLGVFLKDIKKAKEEEKLANIRNEELNKEREKRRLEERKLEIARAEVNLEVWKSGTNIGGISILPYAYGRIESGRITLNDGYNDIPFKETIELVTSKGARVPIEHIKKVSKLIRSILENHKTYKKNGHTIHLGHYVLDEIKENGELVAGCHIFQKEEVLRILDLVDKEYLHTHKAINCEALCD